MMTTSGGNSSAFIGFGLIAGLAILGFFIQSAVKTNRGFDRTVTVRGLAEQEHIADVVIWPIQFTQASNSQQEIYTLLDDDAEKVIAFLVRNGINTEDISVSTPSVTDRSAQVWAAEGTPAFRFVGSQTVTIYSNDVEGVRRLMGTISELGRQGVVIAASDYQYSVQYLFTRLNDIKPQMVEEATVEARKVAEKFAEDSNSRLGKIKTATQGQFSITDRDMNNPHIKNIRVVSTIVYYLVD